MKFQVQVPASTANLGPAFDSAAIALDLHLRVSVESIEGETGTPSFEVFYRGKHAERVELGEKNLVVMGARHAIATADRNTASARLQIENEIPIGVGLGSSAAAIVAGLLIGRRLGGVADDPEVILRDALELEDHPDNISAALLGGVVVAAIVPSGGGSRAVRVLQTEVPSDLHFIAVTPEIPLPTERARQALPEKYSRADVVHNLQRTALLSAAFFSGRRLSPDFFCDQIHQPFRASLVPGIGACLQFRHQDLGGIFLSGAGSSIMALAYGSERQIGEALVDLFRQNGVRANFVTLQGDSQGAQIQAWDT